VGTYVGRVNGVATVGGRGMEGGGGLQKEGTRGYEEKGTYCFGATNILYMYMYVAY
jgi:hypothetical protein